MDKKEIVVYLEELRKRMYEDVDINNSYIDSLTEIIDKIKPEYPLFVKMGDNCCLRLIEEGGVYFYYRDAGDWRILIDKKDGKLYSSDPYEEDSFLNNIELVECGREEWLEDNAGYLPVISENYEEDDIPF